MPAFRAERVELCEDLSSRDHRCHAGARGWTVPGDLTGLAAAPDFALVRFDSGAVLPVRKSSLRPLPWPEVVSA